jgi:hypothetical protein
LLEWGHSLLLGWAVQRAALTLHPSLTCKVDKGLVAHSLYEQAPEQGKRSVSAGSPLG